MNYGLIEGSLTGIDFSLPPDTELTNRTLQAPKPPALIDVKVGAARWGCKAWVGKIYPPGTKDKEFVSHYARQFSTVELGATFYVLPGADQISTWTAQVSGRQDFQFCPKFPQKITHIRRLSNAEQATQEFYERLQAFGSHGGPLLLQLPDNFKPNAYSALEAYLKSLPKTHQVFVELRNKDWFADPGDRAKVFHLLSEQQIGAVISDTAGRRDAVHMELPTREVMIRFVGNDLDASDYTRIDDWVERLAKWSAKGLEKVWFFVHTNDERYTPELAAYLIQKLNQKLGTQLQPPVFHQQALF